MGELLSIAKKVVSSYILCHWCLGRLFGGLSTGISNWERGKAIIEYIKMDIHYRIINGKRVPKKLINYLASYYSDQKYNELLKSYGIKLERPKTQRNRCYICEGILDELDKITEIVFNESKKYKFNTFQIGIQKLTDIEKREEEIKRRYGIWFGENIRNELSREIGKALVDKFKRNGIDVVYTSASPDISIIVDIVSRTVEISAKPIEILINATRLSESTPIFSMNCSTCKGVGCRDCNYTGREKGESFESIVGYHLIDIFNGDRWKFGIKYLDKNKIRFQARFKIMNPKKHQEISKLEEIIKKIDTRNKFKIDSLTIR